MLKTLDKQGRWRNVIVSFRVSPEERDDLDARVKLSGLTKQDYIVKRLSERDVIVQGNTRVFKALRNQMSEILSELKRIENCSDLTEDFISMISTVAQTYNGLEEKSDEK
ncbi:MAG: mobilization protein [Bacteroidales bacterium]|nr:mobilization protein [Bacteroidales bacterium]